MKKLYLLVIAVCIYSSCFAQTDPNPLTVDMIPRITVTGVPDDSFEIQYSSDLLSWNFLTTVSIKDSPVTYFDSQAKGQSRRFYRAIKLPPPEMLLYSFVSSSRRTLGDSESIGEFTINFKLDATDEDVYIPTDGSGIQYNLIDASTGEVVSQPRTIALTASNLTKTNGHYEVREGDTGAFSFRVIVDNTTGLKPVTLRLRLRGIWCRFRSTTTQLVNSNVVVSGDSITPACFINKGG